MFPFQGGKEKKKQTNPQNTTNLKLGNFPPKTQYVTPSSLKPHSLWNKAPFSFLFAKVFAKMKPGEVLEEDLAQDPDTIFCLLISRRFIKKGTSLNPSPFSKTDSYP